MAIDYRTALNDSQYEAVVCCDVPSLVIAGAGSGKTRVLTYKIAYLLERHQYAPENILALTFTNKAAREMRERIAALLDSTYARYLWMGTFHSIFARILRLEGGVLGYSKDYIIYDTQDTKSVISILVKEMGLDIHVYKPETVASRISEAKNKMLWASNYARSQTLLKRDEMAKMGEIHRIYAAYEKKLKSNDAMDFDDLLLNTYHLFLMHPNVRRRYQERFQYVLVDEYQDTNKVQHQIVMQLTDRHHRVCVVGDDAQSIYSFRGAEMGNILHFQNLYEGTRLFKLERNYRSTQTIVAAAGSLIAKNRNQIHKNVYSENTKGEPVEVCEAFSGREEASIVARKVEALRRWSDMQYSDIAVLYRTNSQSRQFEEEFRMWDFPYRIVGGVSFYQRKEVKDAIAYFRLLVNPYDDTSLYRIINVPIRGLGKTTLDRISQRATENGVRMWDVMCNTVKYPINVNAGIFLRLRKFVAILKEAQDVMKRCDAHQAALHIINTSGLKKDIFKGNDEEDIIRQQNLTELLNSMATFVADEQEEGRRASLTDYLQHISLLTDHDEADSEGGNRITLMTAHAAKGLEFNAVFVVGMEEGLFPSDMSFSSPNSMEEERRLLYVAMTRAKERLFLTWSHTRTRYGRFDNNVRSRFIREIDSRYLSGQRINTASAFPHTLSPTTIDERPPKLHNSSIAKVHNAVENFKVGDKVEHARFGVGVIRKFEGDGLDTKAIVDFQNQGEKRLLLRFANLTPKA